LNVIATAYVPGLLLGLSLIVAIGAQNAFVLRQGLRREHVGLVCLICAGSDAALIAAGVAGFGRAVAALPWLAPLMRYGGVAFLLVYGGRAFWAAARPGPALSPLGGPGAPLGRTVLTVLAFTWLNPHVYLDTLVLLGSVSTRYGAHGRAFALGAMSGSVLFFFSLGFGARYLAPLFARPGAWRVLDFLIGCVMVAVAASLVL
jgi:L-lysine exporter family protein LysE/ArgO